MLSRIMMYNLVKNYDDYVFLQVCENKIKMFCIKFSLYRTVSNVHDILNSSAYQKTTEVLRFLDNTIPL